MEEKEYRKVESSASVPGQVLKICRVCQSNLVDGDQFCSECGTPVVQSGHICKVCNTESFGEVCGNCGTHQIFVSCKHCGAEAKGDFCEDCGKPLTELGELYIQNIQKNTEPGELSREEAETIQKSLFSGLGSDFQRREERRLEKIMLLEERAFFQEREKRIEEFYKSGIVKFQRREDGEIQKIREKIQAGAGYLSRRVREKEEREAEEKRLAEELRIAEEKRKEEERILRLQKEEQERKRKQEERILREKRLAEEKKREEERARAEEIRKAEERRLAEERKKALQVAEAKEKELERKKREEELKKQREREEREEKEAKEKAHTLLVEILRRAEQEAREEEKRRQEAAEARRRERILEERRREEARRERWLNRIDGIYVAQYYPGTFIIKIEGGRGNGMIHGPEYNGRLLSKYQFSLDISWDGDRISFYNENASFEYTTRGVTTHQIRFIGRASNDGEILRGYCYSAETWEEVFVKE